MISSTPKISLMYKLLVLTALLPLGQACKSTDDDDACGTDRRLALLPPRLQLDEISNMVQDCAQLEYSTYLAIVYTHAGLAAVPSKISHNCPMLFFDDETKGSGKRILPLKDLPTDIVHDVPRYELGSFPLKAILGAFDAARDSDSEGEGYDLMANNCATFVISMMEALNVPVSTDHAAFAAEHLDELDTSGWITKALRAHKYFATIFPGGDSMSNTGLMHEFVAEYVRNHRDVGHK